MWFVRRILRWGEGPVPEPAVLAYARFLVGDVHGRVIAELEAELEAVAWRLTGTGVGAMTVARTDDKALESYLRFGNRFLISFENGLPNWGGVIDVPREWDPEGRIDVSLYGPRQILGWRRTAKERIFNGETVGGIVQALIEEANAERDTGIRIGADWYYGGAVFSPEYHLSNVLKAIEQLTGGEYTELDFWISAALEDGKIVFTAHLAQQRGMDRSGQVVLFEGENISDLELVEQGPIVNDWAVAAAGSTWDDARAVEYAVDATSAGAYDLRQDAMVLTDTGEGGTAAEVAATQLAVAKDPRNRLALKALDRTPAKFASYDVGDVIRVVAYSVGFGGYDHDVRVLTREYEIGGGYCSLVVEEV